MRRNVREDIITYRNVVSGCDIQVRLSRDVSSPRIEHSSLTVISPLPSSPLPVDDQKSPPRSIPNRQRALLRSLLFFSADTTSNTLTSRGAHARMQHTRDGGGDQATDVGVNPFIYRLTVALEWNETTSARYILGMPPVTQHCDNLRRHTTRDSRRRIVSLNKYIGRLLSLSFGEQIPRATRTHNLFTRTRTTPRHAPRACVPPPSLPAVGARRPEQNRRLRSGSAAPCALSLSPARGPLYRSDRVRLP